MSKKEKLKKITIAFFKSRTGIISVTALVIAALISVVGCIYSTKNGWKKKGDFLVYMASGAEKTGKVRIGGNDFIFDDAGHLFLGWFSFENNIYYQDPKGLFKGEKKIGGESFRFEEDGRFLAGAYKKDDTLYFHDDHGFTPTGEQAYAGCYYYVNDDGKLFTGWKDKNTGPYYDTETGKRAEGVTDIDGNVYCFGPDGKILTGFYTQWDGTRYFGTDGAELTGRQEIDGVEYYFGTDGLLTKGLVKTDDATYYFDDAGSVKGWVNDNGLIRYFDDEGKMVTGELEIAGVKYLFNDEGYTRFGWDGDVYYNHGYLANGITTIDSKVYYFNEDGTLFGGGWVEVGGRKYHFESDGSATDGWATVDGLNYFFYSDGKMAINLTSTPTGVYCFNSEGQPLEPGWQTAGDGSKCYVFDGGKVATGEVTVGDVKCFFSDRGRLIAGPDEFAEMLEKAAGYESKTDYLILVNRSLHMVAVYQKSGDGYTLVNSFRCTVGAGDSQTITGEYDINGRLYYFDHDKSRLFYATRIYRGYFFHSVIYRQDPTPTQIIDGRIGQDLSLGCVRLEIDNAKYIYDSIPNGTKVVIY